MGSGFLLRAAGRRLFSVVIASDDKALDKLIKSAPKGRLLVVDYYADWCGPCKRFEPTYEALSNKYDADADFIKINIENASEHAAEASISSVPSFQLIKDGAVVDLVVGADQQTLEDAIDARK
uniref:Thioredoxin domain-containing protein n=1 Tax=Spongospora subterranea TaxID=70186 RepID=A0A0H5R7C4_9EUKA|eukprot:CRZ10008.1 hypothetical protein [Spongospora subterranea]